MYSFQSRAIEFVIFMAFKTFQHTVIMYANRKVYELWHMCLIHGLPHRKHVNLTETNY